MFVIFCCCLCEVEDDGGVQELYDDDYEWKIQTTPTI